MQFSDNLVKFSLSLLSLVLLGMFISSYMSLGDKQYYLLILGFSTALLAYKFSDGFKVKNNINKLMFRDGNHLSISSVKQFPLNNKSKVEVIEIGRISVITIGKDWLSVIIDGNGNGYDFQLLGSESEIRNQINLLLTEQELSTIKVNKA